MATGTSALTNPDDDLMSSFFSQPGQDQAKTMQPLASHVGQPQELTSSMFDPMSPPTTTSAPTSTSFSAPPQDTQARTPTTNPLDYANQGSGATTQVAANTDVGAKYTQQVQQLSQIADPQQRAVAQDQLARSIYTDLQGAGHDVKWSGNQLIVDGRPYEVAGTDITAPHPMTGGEELLVRSTNQAIAQNPNAGAMAGGPLATNPNTGIAGGMDTSVSGPTSVAATSGQPYTGGTYGDVPGNVEGVDATKWADPNKHDTKYDVLHLLSQAGSVDAAWPQIQQLYPNAQRISGDVIDFGDGFGPVDVQRDYSGGGGFHWEPTSGAGQQPGAPAAPGAPPAPGPAGAGGVDVTQAPNPLTAAPTYTPGDITIDDIPKASYADLMNQMGPDYQPTPVSGSDYQAQQISAHDPGSYDFNGFDTSSLPGLDTGTVGQSEDDLVNSILQHPESIDAQTLARLKAKGRQDQSDLYAQEQDNLTGIGAANGIGDSTWLASQRAQSMRDRDASVMKSNQDAEIQAATTNAADRRSAAALGQGYTTAKGNLQIAQRGQLFGEQQTGEQNKQASAQSKLQRAQYLTGVDTANATAQLNAAQLRAQSDIANNSNMFNAAKLRQDKVISSVNADLAAAAATTDRMRLNEQAKQAATDLGISQEKVMSQWLESQMQDATQRYGIDTSADVDQLKLHLSDKEFMADLAFKYAQLSQQDDQFGASYGLGVANLQENATEANTNSYLRSLGM